MCLIVDGVILACGELTGDARKGALSSARHGPCFLAASGAWPGEVEALGKRRVGSVLERRPGSGVCSLCVSSGCAVVVVHCEGLCAKSVLAVCLRVLVVCSCV